MRLALTLSALSAVALLGTAPARADHHEAAAAEPPAERAVVVAEKIELTGKVVAVDKEARSIIVEGSQGNRVELDAPEAAANFDQIAVGDDVKATYFEAVALSIHPASDAKPGAAETTVAALAPPGETPGGVVADTVQLKAVVRAVDVDARLVTLELPTGENVTLRAGKGVDLARVKVGEEVVATHTEALAIRISKP